VAVQRMCAHSSGVKKTTEPKQIVTVAGFEKRFFLFSSYCIRPLCGHGIYTNPVPRLLAVTTDLV
jgi:hypothetical protein